MNDVSQSTVILKPAASDHGFDFDVTIVGAGPVGLALAGWLARLNQGANGNASRLEWIALLDQPASIDRGEITDKGSINQRAVLKHRDALVQALHDNTAPGILLPQA